MMSAELNHPRVFWRRRAKNSNVVFRASEPGANSRSASWRARSLEVFVRIHDIDDFPITAWTQCRGDESKCRLLLGGGHVAKLHAIAFEAETVGTVRKVRPASPRGLVEIDFDFRLLTSVKSRQESLRCSDRFTRRAGS